MEIEALVFRPTDPQLELQLVRPTLEGISALVGGALEFVPISHPDSMLGEIHGYVNENGRHLGLPVNFAAMEAVCAIQGESADYRGTMVVFGASSDGEERALTPAQREVLMRGRE